MHHIISWMETDYAGCYDRIMPNVALINSQKFSATKNGMLNPRKSLAGTPTPCENSKRCQPKPLPTRSKRKNPLRILTGQRLRHPMLGRDNTTNHCNP
jgi:hypothetical protein